MHYQVVVLDSDINSAVQIESISWKRSTIGVDSGIFTNFKIYMGYSTLDQLGDTFSANYIQGTRTLVYSNPSYQVVAGGPNNWFTTTLDTPFWYSGNNNLIIEFEWSTGAGSIYAWHWAAGPNRAIFGAYGSDTSDGSENSIPHMMINGPVGLQSETLGSIKATFGGE